MSEKFLVRLIDADVVLSGKAVLHGINWQIRPGEHWRVDGQNGAGKTTLLKTIAGLTWPVAKQPPSRLFGLNGPATHLLSGVKQSIGFASYGMQDEYVRGRRNITCHEVIASGFEQNIMVYDELTTGQQQAVEALAAQLDISKLLNHSFLSISHGQKSAVLFARAYIHQPRLLILDEIFNGVDQNRFNLMVRLLEQYQKQGGQMVLSWHEHGIEAIERLFTHALLLDQGKVIKAGQNVAKVTQGNKAPAKPRKLNYSELKQTKLLELKKLNVYLQNRPILKNINWTVYQHERWLLKGKNGAGKTTLLKTLLAEIRPAMGSEIWRRGFGQRASVWQIRKLIGYISPELQQAYQYNISVFDTVGSGFFSSIGLYDEISDQQTEKVYQLLEALDLQQLAATGVHQISSGQMRRVLIARAMVHNPDILIFDEVTANLDRQSRAVILACIEDLIGQGKTMIFVGHHENELIGLYNRTLKLIDGTATIQATHG